MDPATLETYDASLRRCSARQGFLDRFYLRFMASSPQVREKFAETDFVHQKIALRASLHVMTLAVADGREGLDRHLRDLAVKHGRSDLDVGAAMYDFWIDALLATVREYDPEFTPEVESAWEGVMQVGIRYLLDHRDSAPRPD
jgi:hemoglobin-like flavoprotein